ncbi:MAG: GIY-YIG nuclease family protein [Nitrosomonas sp.]|nr:GIY-YIG nuclease family protein [Nitrosomonas sp.]
MNNPLLCEAITGKGTQCTKKHKHFSAISARNLCTIHLKKEQNDHIDKLATEQHLTVASQHTIESIGLSVKLLSSKAKNKLMKHLKKGLKASDGTGEIYIYHLANEQGMNYWKVGMTKKDADTRLKEWENEHKMRILKRAAFKVKRGTLFVERTIHLYLSYCRMLRCPVDQGKTMYSVWYESNNPIEDVHFETLLDLYDGDEVEMRKAMVGKKKHKEWFFAPIEEILHIVNKITALF